LVKVVMAVAVGADEVVDGRRAGGGAAHAVNTMSKQQME
jgi:hypothetical protein